MQKLVEVAGILCLMMLTVEEALETGQHRYALQVCNKTLKKAKKPLEVALLTVWLDAILIVGVQSGSAAVS
jgi:arginine exporter protein ArgO